LLADIGGGHIQTPNVEGYETNYRELATRKVDVFLGTSRRYVPRFPSRTVSRSH
jgi:hypothetical protein